MVEKNSCCGVGYASSKQIYFEDDETGELIPYNLSADAVMPEARPGVKSGNLLLDEIIDEIRREGLTKKIRESYKLNKEKW